MPKKRQHRTSWSELGAAEQPNGTRSSMFRIGEDDDPTAPTVFRAYFPPGTVVAPHTHACDYAEVILEGAQKIGNTWYGPGDIRVAKANTPYGPLTAGPEGVTVMVIFKDARWQPIPTAKGGTAGLDVEAVFDHFKDSVGRVVPAPA